MGNIYPLPEDPNLNCLAVGFRPTDTIKVFHATKQAIRRIEYIVREVNRITDGSDRLDSEEESPGYHKFQLKSANFNEGAGLEASTAGKLFVLRLLEEMYMMGYDPVVSSDLVREKDVATLFFKKEVWTNLRCCEEMNFLLTLLSMLFKPLGLEEYKRSVYWYREQRMFMK
ncbi:uncharacterized protein LOC111704506 isoform X3 [Eurytemora carolleeae]|nr:uncharacterized protein LOC111704506 isoform X3 [Eurytemora carolleeae]XP_023332525.1 uncharacterized protein LOC111704506 isoform X3 [Eurytemora carolleeae]XP_023332526.1 uncharacterized protein LOC111704506 isoform X3 [Eurytemora carolleeae]|eukprot:XP_023332524.1 uncharacterized protein LOC111704506 isoform X3 [Eurytemora affinis]